MYFAIVSLQSRLHQIAIQIALEFVKIRGKGWEEISPILPRSFKATVQKNNSKSSTWLAWFGKQIRFESTQMDDRQFFVLTGQEWDIIAKPFSLFHLLSLTWHYFDANPFPDWGVRFALFLYTPEGYKVWGTPSHEARRRSVGCILHHFLSKTTFTKQNIFWLLSFSILTYSE